MLVELFAGGDFTALLFFSAIGRFTHGFSVFDLLILSSLTTEDHCHRRLKQHMNLASGQSFVDSYLCADMAINPPPSAPQGLWDLLCRHRFSHLYTSIYCYCMIM
ncbi:uncharacterized protein LOC132041001 [Lycium ferocissimum]|uniref:uncharacterized protein LOC132041001 n=1 Tax=Lycium ferocissimum TaxID=112874 RepID=UPI0028157B51|nr:uncharacterized protein LOC132041001 [Lycium ferocissimum]